MNGTQGVGLCRQCESLYALTDLGLSKHDVAAARAAEQAAPHGCVRHEDGQSVVLTASARSPLFGAIAIVIAVTWTSFFAYQFWQSASTVYRSLAGTQPSPLPGGNSQATSFMLAFGEIFAACVMVPFVGVGCVLLVAGAVLLAGRVEVRLSDRRCEVFTGIGPIGWRQRFDRSDILSVRVAEHTDDEGQRRRGPIELRTHAKPVCLGSILKDERYYWLAGVLADELVQERVSTAGTMA